ncbi:hypothetical protein [Pseudonocardia aurantiaca]|uniref:Uncharacterized protein n=1 Tax=Pseudonocardia aurantiaca TaxID=75290 RepID=A0ABW4FJR7_9PSEU
MSQPARLVGASRGYFHVARVPDVGDVVELRVGVAAPDPPERRADVLLLFVTVAIDRRLV